MGAETSRNSYDKNLILIMKYKNMKYKVNKI